MEHRLRTNEGRALYKRRGATVEPAIGNLKTILDRFSRRGLNAALGELQLRRQRLQPDEDLPRSQPLTTPGTEPRPPILTIGPRPAQINSAPQEHSAILRQALPGRRSGN